MNTRTKMSSKTRTAMLATLLASSLTACGEGYESEGYDGGTYDNQELGEAQDGITRGALVPTAEHNAHVVKLTFPGGGRCSGTKIGARRFLTAAHCLPNLVVNNTIQITNRNDGLSQYSRTVSAIHRYPTTPANFASGHWTDVAMFDVTSDTSLIPAFNVFRAPYVGTGQAGVVSAYGCDLANASNNGKKQWGTFQTAFWNDAPSYAGYIYSPTPSPNPAICPGDSGGPFYIQRNGVWEIAGVVAAQGPGNAWFNRVGRVRRWIENPSTNVLTNGSMGALLNRKGNNCIKVASDFSGTVATLAYCDLRNLPVDSQYWKVETLASNFRIKNTWSGHCLAPANLIPGGWRPLDQEKCGTDSWFQWKFVSPVTSNGHTYYHIKNIATNQCIGTNGLVGNGQELRMVNCTGAGFMDEQSFVFVP